MESFFQARGRAGRDWKPATSTLYFNNNDIGANIEEMHPLSKTPEIRAGENFCLTTAVLAKQQISKVLLENSQEYSPLWRITSPFISLLIFSSVLNR